MALRAVSARSALRASLSARAEALSLGPGWNAAALYALEDRGYAHSAADAERHQAVLAARAGQVVKNLDGQDGACGPDGVSQGHCSAYRVHLLLGHLERTLHGDSDGGEGLVRLDGVEVVDREPGLLQGQPGGWDHTRSHDGRVDTGHGRGDQPARHGHPEFLGLALVAHEHHGSPVVDARSVGGGYRAAILLEDRLQLLKSLYARVRADVLVRGELDGLLLLLDLDGYDLAVEQLLFVSLGGPLMAAHGVGVGVLAGYTELLGDVLGRHTHVVVVEDVPQAVVDHVVVDICFGHPHPVAVAALIQQERCPVHVLDAAGHDHVGVAEGYLLRTRDYGLKPRAAHPVQGHARDLDGEAALYADLATRVHALARGKDITDYNLVDLLTLDPGARENLLADRGPEFRGRRVLERTAESSYTRPEGRRDDYLADTVSVAEAHIFSFRLFSIRGYIKGKARTTRPGPFYTLFEWSPFDYWLAPRCTSSRLPL